MCTYLTEKIDVDGSGNGLRRPSGACPLRPHREYRRAQPCAGPVGQGRPRTDRGDCACAGRRNPPRRRLGPRGLGVEEPNGLTASTSEPAASCANRFGGLGVGEGELRLVSACDEERELSRFAGDSQRQTVADNGDRRAVGRL